MRIKKYVGTNIQDMLSQVKLELGRDAIILHTRRFRTGGFLGWFKRDMVEVTAASDDAAASSPPAANPDLGGLPPESRQLGRLQSDVAEIKAMMGQITSRIDVARTANALLCPQPYSVLHARLLAADVDEQLARDLIEELSVKAQAEGITVEIDLKQRLTRIIADTLSAPQPIQLEQGHAQAVIALVGPTGVGKTTTLAKLAANYSLLAKQDVSLITADTYRIAAVEQLKTYGEIIGVKIDVVFTPPELKVALERSVEKDLVLIDTAGRSHLNQMQMSELKSFINAANPDEVYLVLSVTTKFPDIREIIRTYDDVGFTKLIFTKLDETECYGAILNTAILTGKTLSYVTNGQNVPDDIEVANPEKIARMIVG